MLSQVLISAFTCHLSDFPWSVADARRSVQNILSPNRMQEYLKSIREMVYHERTYTGSQTSKFSEKTRLAGRVFSHLEKEINPKSV